MAFVRTTGFWLSLVTLPLLITAIIFVPVLLRQSAPVTVLSVAVLDLSHDHIGGDLRDLVQAKAAPPAGSDALQGLAAKMAHGDVVRLAALPPSLDPASHPGLSVAQAEALIPKLLAAPDAKVSNIILAYDDGDVLQFHLWSTHAQKGKLQDMLQWDLHGLQYYKLAREHGIDHQLAHDMRESRATLVSLSPGTLRAGGALGDMLRDNAPRIIGMMSGYLAWMTIVSSSMILLSGVIEEKSSKVLEVVLASTSAESLLIGKVLGVACVMLTVGAIWSLGGWVLLSSGLSFLPPNMLAAVQAGLAGLFSPLHLLLLAAYFACGYLMFGVSFAAIGAFCETQKDAQAIMGPVMMVLMVPMLCMQSAFIAPESPILRWLSFVPIFTPFLMPLRLAEPLPWWEIALSLTLMVVLMVFMIGVGRRAFRQGALTGGKLSWGLLARIAIRRGAD
ncbi:ABC transporter permease [Asticcacaulis sp. EMRT-3]|uniref:ABC transporter permease n=1 Tax=Asticcacaulis sp. EMRT-3 TaxID=3040349 RepID=UPI0024AECCB0|nr:ABC transporter permease [Asticcacaulis sp. EMRT-3]MDI7774065.1 ABC transporter permease [Asticcacaulis sp. EMRT-3]